MKIALTIAGSDPTGGAGLQADLRVFRAFDVHGLSIVSAVTAQNTEGVDSLFPVEREAFGRQLSVLLADVRPDSLKLGMLYQSWAPELIRETVGQFSLKNLVIDPVTVSSSGMGLSEKGALDSIRDLLFPLSTMITPNIHEASVLSGVMINSREDMQRAARILKGLGPDTVVITGGHLEGIALDLYYDGEFHAIEGEKMSGEYHGTGCAFSAAVTALLAHGRNPLDCVKEAKTFVSDTIRTAWHPGRGMGLLNL